MKFISSFQCLMPANAVQFQNTASSSSLTPTEQSSALILTDNNDGTKSSPNVITKKKKKKKVKQDDRKVIKVFKPNGEINLYKKPIKVSEVMTEEYMVCRSDSFYIGQKIPPLSQHDRLQRGHTYFLLPSHLFHSVLSFVTIASFTSKQQDVDDSNNANMKMKAAFLKKAAASSLSPFDIQKTPSGTLRIRVSELFLSQLMMDQAVSSQRDNENELTNLETTSVDLLCTTPQLHREYKQLVVGSRRNWKPKLEMIRENAPKGKRKVKMLLSASFNRMKKKMKKNKNVRIPPSPSSSSSSTSGSSKKKKKKVKKAKKNNKTTVTIPTLSASNMKENKFSNTKATLVNW